MVNGAHPTVGYLRFVLGIKHPESGVADGLFRTAYALRGADGTSAADRSVLADQIAWFNKHLPVPTRFNRTSSKGHYRRLTKGIAWFRAEALECISRMHEIQRVLEANGYPVTTAHESRIGYIVYQDEFQVIAEPFADTRTG
jgi:hypothetical protein